MGCYFRLFAAGLLGLTLAGQAFAEEWPKVEDWVGKKPSQIMPGFYEDGINFYDWLNLGARPTALWTDDFSDLMGEGMEHPIQKIGQYLVFMAYDCGDKICQKGAALAYNLDGGQTIVCEQTRTREVDQKPVASEGYLYKDHLIFFTAHKSRVIDSKQPYLEKTGYPFSCGGSEKDALNYQATLNHLVLMEQALHFGGIY